jgi:uncharacterized protein
MIPINAYILKTTAFCNLNCSYCYMFNLDDQSFRGRPKVMPLEIVAASARRIAEQARSQEVKAVSIILHGGEPLLAGRDWFHRTVECFRRAGGEDVRFFFAVQTNALPINQAWVDLFREYSMSVSVSLDGPPHINDRARVNFAGRSSYNEVVRGLRMVQHEPFFGGLLCVVDPTASGLEIYQHFRDLDVKTMDFLLPHEHNWDKLPPGHEDPAATPFADYLIPIFDSWWEEDNAEISIRTFQTILGYLIGDRSGIDALGGNPVSFAVIETDGGIEPLDVLRACGDGFTNLGLNIRDHDIAALDGAPLYQEAIKGQEGLCETCAACPLHDVCGAGYLPHRYGLGNGFRNPSVYCRDLWKLITHITDRAMSRLLPAPIPSEPAVVGDSIAMA